MRMQSPAPVGARHARDGMVREAFAPMVRSYGALAWVRARHAMADLDVVTGTEDSILARDRDVGTLGWVPVEPHPPDRTLFAVGDRVVLATWPTRAPPQPKCVK